MNEMIIRIKEHNKFKKKMARFGLDSFASRGILVAGSYECGYETSFSTGDRKLPHYV